MKKIFVTFCTIALFAVAANAQDTKTDKGGEKAKTECASKCTKSADAKCTKTADAKCTKAADAKCTKTADAKSGEAKSCCTKK